MRVNYRLTYRVALAFFFLCSPPSFVQAQDTKAAECDWLLSHIGDSKTVALDGKSLLLDSKTADKILDLRRQMSELPESGIVVYSPVVSAGNMVMLRIEARGSAQPALVSVRETKWNTRTFGTALAAAQQRGGEFFRRDLQRQMITENAQQDLGKTVFFFDPESYGLVPTAFQQENSYILASPKIGQAMSNLSSLRSNGPPASGFVALLGLPSNEAEYKAVFGENKKFGDLTEWQQHSHEAQAALAGHGIRVIGGGEKMPPAKEQVLHGLEDQPGIIFLVAHADGAHIFLPGSGHPIDISPSDIASLHFTKKPLVILRICQGEDHGFANAFIEAGAGAVWANRGVIRADVAIQQIKLFLDGLDPKGNPLAVIGTVLERSPEAKASSALFTELRPPNGEIENNANFTLEH